MQIRGKTVFVFDIEVFQNIFHCSVKIQKQEKYTNLKSLKERIN